MEGMTTTLHLHGGRAEQLDVWKGEGDHGGADPVMLGYLFDPAGMEPDRYNRSSNHVSGAWSILTGIAANISIATGKEVVVDELLRENGVVIG
jgi:hypothetical protein